MSIILNFYETFYFFFYHPIYTHCLIQAILIFLNNTLALCRPMSTYSLHYTDILFTFSITFVMFTVHFVCLPRIYVLYTGLVHKSCTTLIPLQNSVSTSFRHWYIVSVYIEKNNKKNKENRTKGEKGKRVDEVTPSDWNEFFKTCNKLL